MGHSGDDAVHKKSNKMKTHWPNWLKFLVLAYFKVLFRTGYKEIDVILVQCPFHYALKVIKTSPFRELAITFEVTFVDVHSIIFLIQMSAA